jgi:hypothetical protein
VRADVLKREPVPKWIGGAYDYWLGYRIARRREPVVRVADALSYWREHDENLTKQQTSPAASVARVRMDLVLIADSAIPCRYRWAAGRRLPRGLAAVLKAVTKSLPALSRRHDG